MPNASNNFIVYHVIFLFICILSKVLNMFYIHLEDFLKVPFILVLTLKSKNSCFVCIF
jgi:hypothetical protein